MSRTILAILFMLTLLAVGPSAQALCIGGTSTCVSVTVVDSGGQAWANGTVTFTYNGPVNATWAGGNLPLTFSTSLGSSGTAGAIAIPDNNQIVPSPSFWNIRACPQLGITAQCFVQSAVTITGASQTVTLTPPAIAISGNSQLPVAAYADSEIVAPVITGFIYDQLTDVGVGSYRECDAVNASGACTTWNSVGGTTACGASDGQILYASAGTCAGSADLIFDGTNLQLFTPSGTAGLIAGADGTNGLIVSGGHTELDALEPTSFLRMRADSDITLTSNNGNFGISAPTGVGNWSFGSTFQLTSTNFNVSPSSIVETAGTAFTQKVGSASPVTPGSVIQRVVTGTTDTIVSTDRQNRVAYNSASAVAVTLPQAGSSGFAGGFNLRVSNQNTGVVTITPTISLVNGAPTLVLQEGQFCFITPSSAGTDYAADCGESQITAGANVSLTRAVHGLTIGLTGLSPAPQTLAAATNQFVNSYVQGTGLLGTAEVTGNDINGATSLPAYTLTGTPNTGNATTSVPLWYYFCSGAAAPTTWSTNGTIFGLNACTGFVGKYIDIKTPNGGGTVFSVDQAGGMAVGTVAGSSGITAAAGSNIGLNGRTQFRSAADGRISANNNANGSAGLTRFTLGTEASGNPAMCPSAQTWVTCDGAGTTANGALKSASYSVVNLLANATAPTIAVGGCGGAAASISANNGTAAFNINVGTTPTAAGCTVTMPAATTGWNCQVNDMTTVTTAVSMQKQTGAISTTSVVLQNFSDVTVATAPVASDIYHVVCSAY